MNKKRKKTPRYQSGGALGMYQAAAHAVGQIPQLTTTNTSPSTTGASNNPLSFLSGVAGAIPNPASLAISAGLGAMGQMFFDKEPSEYVPLRNNNMPMGRGFKFGGSLNDEKLSTDAAQVKGNPNITDGNRRTVYGKDVYLDNEEVITTGSVAGSYALSPNLINPLTGNTLAKDGKKVKKAQGKAEKYLQKVDPTDAYSAATISHSKSVFDQLVLENERQLAADPEGTKHVQETMKYYNGGRMQDTSKSKSSDKLYEKKYGGKLRYQDGGALRYNPPAIGYTPQPQYLAATMGGSPSADFVPDSSDVQRWMADNQAYVQSKTKSPEYMYSLWQQGLDPRTGLPLADRYTQGGVGTYGRTPTPDTTTIPSTVGEYPQLSPAQGQPLSPRRMDQMSQEWLQNGYASYNYPTFEQAISNLPENQINDYISILSKIQTDSYREPALAGLGYRRLQQGPDIPAGYEQNVTPVNAEGIVDNMRRASEVSGFMGDPDAASLPTSTGRVTPPRETRFSPDLGGGRDAGVSAGSTGNRGLSDDPVMPYSYDEQGRAYGWSQARGQYRVPSADKRPTTRRTADARTSGAGDPYEFVNRLLPPNLVGGLASVPITGENYLGLANAAQRRGQRAELDEAAGRGAQVGAVAGDTRTGQPRKGGRGGLTPEQRAARNRQAGAPEGVDVLAFQRWYDSTFNEGKMGQDEYALGDSGVDGVWGPKTAQAWADYGAGYNRAMQSRSHLGTNPLETYKPQDLFNRETPAPDFSNLPQSKEDDGKRSLLEDMSWGDVLQGAELMSKAFGLGKGPEVESLDRMRTRQVDVTPYVQRARAGYNAATASNRGATASANRTVRQGAYDSYLNNLTQVGFQADTMNKQLASQAESFNVQQSNLEKDINARNRGAYDAAVQNLFTSVGNTGRAANQQRANREAQAFIAEAFPDVYDYLINDTMARTQNRRSTGTRKTTNS